MLPSRRTRKILKLLIRAFGGKLSGNKERLKKNSRLITLQLLQGQVEALTYRVSGIEWTTHAHGTVTQRLFAGGGYQLEDMDGVIAWLNNHGRPIVEKSFLVNIGANIGSTAIPLVQKTGLSVLAVEPDPGNFEYLERNVIRNGLSDKIRLVHAAITSEPGEVSLVTTSDPAWSEVKTSGAVQGYGERRPEDNAFRVPGRRLDELVDEEGIASESVGFVWSDTQGHEAHVIELGRSLWSLACPASRNSGRPGSKHTREWTGSCSW